MKVWRQREDGWRNFIRLRLQEVLLDRVVNKGCEGD